MSERVHMHSFKLIICKLDPKYLIYPRHLIRMKFQSYDKNNPG